MNQSIASRFNLVLSSAIGVLMLIVLAVGGLRGSQSLKADLAGMIISQAHTLLSSHLQERRTNQYLTLQNLLRSIKYVESVAILDENCHLLTPSLSMLRLEGDCHQNDGFLRVDYADVVSPIRFIVIKANLPEIGYGGIAIWFVYALCISLLGFWIISISWNRYVYRPLVSEIGSLVRNPARANITELSTVAEAVSVLLDERQSHLKREMKMVEDEKKYQVALRVAHDILVPVRAMKESKELQNIPVLQKNIQCLEAIAWDLLPEKAPIKLVATDVYQLLDQVWSNLKIVFTNHKVVFNGSRNSVALTSSTHAIRAIQNLLKNALEAQPVLIPLIIEVGSVDSCVVVQIIDAGPGYDGKCNESSKIAGSGLGVQSARAILSLLSVSLDYEKLPSGGTITKLKFPEASKTVYHGPNQKVVSFGANIEGVEKLLSLSLLTPMHVVISPFERPKEALGVWHSWQEGFGLELKLLQRASLIEDDRYVRLVWLKAAQEAGITLSVYDTETREQLDEFVFLDRFLYEKDSSDWAKELAQQGHKVFSISVLSNHGKVPIWMS